MFFSHRCKAKGALHTTAIVLFCLCAALAFMGCQPEPDVENTGFIPLGEWIFTAGEYSEGYNITSTSLEFTGWGAFKGSIADAVDFSANAGVLLIQVTEFDDDIIGKFIGVYYKEYTASHVFLANAIDESYDLIVRNTLAEAKNTFTVDKVEDHVTEWGSGYTK